MLLNVFKQTVVEMYWSLMHACLTTLFFTAAMRATNPQQQLLPLQDNSRVEVRLRGCFSTEG